MKTKKRARIYTAPQLQALHAWQAMRQRCYNPNAHNFRYYGKRGIRMCWHWRKAFDNFLADMGEPPSPDHSIDRIDNDGNYEPGNCRWATRSEQQRNKRKPAPRPITRRRVP